MENSKKRKQNKTVEVDGIKFNDFGGVKIKQTQIFIIRFSAKKGITLLAIPLF